MPKGRKLFNSLKTTQQERIDADREQVEAWMKKRKVKKEVAPTRDSRHP